MDLAPDTGDTAPMTAAFGQMNVPAQPEPEQTAPAAPPEFVPSTPQMAPNEPTPEPAPTPEMPRAPDTPAAAAPEKSAEMPPLEADEWSSGCDVVQVFRAHGAPTTDDQSPFLVPPETETTRRFYFRSPWQGDMRLLKSRNAGASSKVVHHWVLYTLDNAEIADGKIISEIDLLDLLRINEEARFLVGGGPGASELKMPPDVGLLMPSGVHAGYLLEVHYYNPSTEAVEADTTGVELCLTSKAMPSEAAAHMLGRQSFKVAAHRTTDVVATCKPTQQTQPVHIMGITPHMHQTGIQAKVVLNRGDGTQLTLLDGPYDSQEQRTHRVPELPAEGDDVIVQPGDTLTTTCTYDNTTDRAINSGPSVEDEMCLVMVWAWPAGVLKNEYELGRDFGTAEDKDCMEP